MNQSLRVLVAEDERDTRESLQEMLWRLGHQVLGAQTGRQLVELARAGAPDLIITAIKMPDMDGIDAVAEVNRLRQTPAILLTGHHDASLLERATQQLVMAYLIKPVKPADIEAAVAVALARFEQYRQARREDQQRFDEAVLWLGRKLDQVPVEETAEKPKDRGKAKKGRSPQTQDHMPREPANRRFSRFLAAVRALCGLRAPDQGSRGQAL
jgi:AmiR/NasT family two-component response regulator